MKCPHCGEDAIINDIFAGSICQECGCVVSDDIFEDNSDDIFRNAPPTGALPAGVSGSILALKRESDKQMNGSLSKFECKIGLTEIEITCTALNLGVPMKEESEELLSRACENEVMNVRYRSRQYKEILGACCVYITLRNHEYPITARELVTLRKLPINKFLVMLRHLKKYMQIDFPKWSIGQQTVHTLRQGKFSKEILERTHKLIQVCEKSWLTCGRNPENIIKSAAYFSWMSFQSLRPNEKSPDFKEFCKTHNLSPPTGRARAELKQMKSILSEMAKCIPWILNFQSSKLQFYISDIIKYKSSLTRKAFKRQREDENECDTSKKMKEETDGKSCDDIDAEIHAKYGDILDSSELHPSEFEDEMPEYIKTDQEKKDAELIKKLNSEKIVCAE